MRRLLWMMGVFKIPMLGFCRPKLIAIDDEQSVVRIKLRKRTKNHLGSMYFGALSVGADVTAGILMYHFSVKNSTKISFAFKSMHADFLQRAESDVYFYCEAGKTVCDVLAKAENSKERQNQEVLVLAKNKNDELVAELRMNMSVKVK